MSQKQTFVFKAINSTRLLNDHVAKVIAPGLYEGMMIEPTTPQTMYVGLTKGFAFTDEGVKIEETADIGLTLGDDPSIYPELKFLEIDEPDPDYPRRDLIVLRHRYRTYTSIDDPSQNPNVAEYVVIRGNPTPYTKGEAKVDESQMQDGDIPMAEILVRPGMTSIGHSDIFNRTRTLTSTGLMDQVSNALYLGLGNFVFDGWQLDSDELNVIVSPGTGLLAGAANTSDEDYVITTLRAREYLYNERNKDNETGLYTGSLRYTGDNLTLDKQPDYPSILNVFVMSAIDNLEADVYISGWDLNGNYVDNYRLHVVCPEANTVYKFPTTTIFKTVDHEGIDAHELELLDPGSRLWVKDNPIAYIYAIGTNSGRPLFEAVYERWAPLPRHKMYLGYAITDEHEVIELYRWVTDSFAEVVEDLTTNGRADGRNKVFIMSDMPKENTEMVVLDGLVLMRDSPNKKGYTINANVITLQENVQAPDSTGEGLTGTLPADFWVRYRRV